MDAFPAAAVRQKSTVPRVANFFTIKRGLATGNNSYFILSAEELEERKLPKQCFRPILPSPRYVSTDEIEADARATRSLTVSSSFLTPHTTKMKSKKTSPRFGHTSKRAKRRSFTKGIYAGTERDGTRRRIGHLPRSCVRISGEVTRKATAVVRSALYLMIRGLPSANVYLAMYPTVVLSRAMDREPGLIPPRVAGTEPHNA